MKKLRVCPECKLMALDEKEVAKVLELSWNYMNPMANLFPNLANAVCFKFCAPNLPTVEEIKNILLLQGDLNSGERLKDCFERYAQAIHKRLTEGK